MPSTEKLELPQREEDVEESSEEEEGNNEEGVALSDIDSDAERDADLVIHHKVHKDNHAALSQALSSIALPIPTLSFHVHMSVTSSEAVSIDINDDLSREQAFNKQALEAALEGRRKLLSEGIPFTRPSDYFAEMIKDDEHMEKIRDRLVQEEAVKKASSEAKKQRDLKKFGKQVQVEKLKEREKEKRTMLEKVKALKRKRQGADALTTEQDFDVELEAANETPRGKRPKMNREKRNEKYGFGGNKRQAKRNDDDAGDLSGLDRRSRPAGNKKGIPKGGKKKQRPGKQRRMQKRS